MNTSQLPYFIGASILLTIAPGPDIIYVLAQGVSNGKRSAVITALGLCSGITIHTIAAALGLSVIFHTSSFAFNSLKYAGVAYLLFLAYKAVVNSKQFLHSNTPPQLTYKSLFQRGFIMNLLNPKVSLFFLAFLPQFITPNSKHIALEMAALGAIFMIQAIIIFTIVGLCAGTIGDRILKQPPVARSLSLITAAIFIILSIRLALMQH